MEIEVIDLSKLNNFEQVFKYFRFFLPESSNIVIVERILLGPPVEYIKLTASHIRLASNFSPMRLIYFIEEGEWEQD